MVIANLDRLARSMAFISNLMIRLQVRINRMDIGETKFG